MDETDRKILDYLKENGRAPFTDVAEEVGVSEGTVRNRVDRMKEERTIENFTVEISSQGVGAVVMVQISTDRSISDIVDEFPERVEVYEVAGEYDLVVEMEREDTEQLNNAIDAVRKVAGVEDTTTFSVLKSYSR